MTVWGAAKGSVVKSTRHTKKVKDLEREFAIEQDKIDALFRSGKIPTAKDWEPVKRIEKQLRTARGILTREKKRKSPPLTKTISFMMTDKEYETLQARAKAKGVRLGKYVRELVRKAMAKVEG